MLYGFPCTVGSSPLARGLPAYIRGEASQRRIIPARAGFTRRPGRCPTASPDHPRSRGVYVDVSRVHCGLSGSSPLARGLHSDFKAAGDILWIIPARAGFTGPMGSCRWSAGDHPRSRGVYAAAGPGSVGVGGSSPLARGLPARGWDLGPRRRIIPARAGFTGGYGVRCPPHQDHPRSRGVYDLADRLSPMAVGSSPLARGLRWLREHDYYIEGIIPARAGFTIRIRDARGAHSDHPRSRGVYQTP